MEKITSLQNNFVCLWNEDLVKKYQISLLTLDEWLENNDYLKNHHLVLILNYADHSKRCEIYYDYEYGLLLNLDVIELDKINAKDWFNTIMDSLKKVVGQVWYKNLDALAKQYASNEQIIIANFLQFAFKNNTYELSNHNDLILYKVPVSNLKIKVEHLHLDFLVKNTFWAMKCVLNKDQTYSLTFFDLLGRNNIYSQVLTFHLDLMNFDELFAKNTLFEFHKIKLYDTFKNSQIAFNFGFKVIEDDLHLSSMVVLDENKFNPDTVDEKTITNFNNDFLSYFHPIKNHLSLWAVRIPIITKINWFHYTCFYLILHNLVDIIYYTKQDEIAFSDYLAFKEQLKLAYKNQTLLKK